MAISPVNVVRVSHNLRSQYLLDAVRRTQQDLLLAQTQLATGRRFVSPGEDPIAANRSLDLTQAIRRQERFADNVQHADNFLSFADSTLTELNDLLVQVSTIASRTVSNLTSADERAAEAEIVARIRDQIVAIGNRIFGEKHVFAGRDTVSPPFVSALSGVAYVGDLLGIDTRVDDGLFARITVPGNELLGALSAPVSGGADLTPALLSGTRLDAIRGANDRPIQLGSLVFDERGGAGVFHVDLAGANSIGDVVTRINEAASEAGAAMTAALGDNGLILTPGTFPVSVTDASAGAVAASLGILTRTPTTSTIVGETLTPRMTRTTPVEALAGGSAIDLTSGIIITNDTASALLDFSDARTVQDILNAIDNAGVYALARISEDGTRIEVFNQVSGSSLTIGENGGTTATDLGIRTLSRATPLAALNDGRGVGTVEGQDDIRITASDGSAFDVNLDGAATLGDVIGAINQAAADESVDVSAVLVATGNGIRLVDGTGGADSLAIGALNHSTAVADLGLSDPVTVNQTELIGGDVNPVRSHGILTALFDLERALRADNTAGITDAGTRIDAATQEVIRIHGIIGARAFGVRTKAAHLQGAAATTQLILSQIQDVDFAEAVTRMQTAAAQLQAGLQTGASLMNLSLMEFLR